MHWRLYVAVPINSASIKYR